ncbi:unnamed protein product [Anisakis simplex]|uniref:Uncharacterized protein n=1 Tax=Anisakis simplex TaxID=6269 RepID=A0A3P6QI71_ANISI|nr:unnamed protein product [Anisakis simplex]
MITSHVLYLQTIFKRQQWHTWLVIQLLRCIYKLQLWRQSFALNSMNFLNENSFDSGSRTFQSGELTVTKGPEETTQHF